MKLNRNSKKWKELYHEHLMESTKCLGMTKSAITGKKLIQDHDVTSYGGLIPKFTGPFWDRKPVMIEVDEYSRVDAMPDRIKEAEEYADRLFSAMR